jgi:hypothetical protein
MGFTTLYDEVNTFQPDNVKCGPEDQQYTIARKNGDDPVKQPTPLPRASS